VPEGDRLVERRARLGAPHRPLLMPSHVGQTPSTALSVVPAAPHGTLQACGAPCHCRWMQAVQLAQVPSKTARHLRRGWPVGQRALCSRGARCPARAQGKGVNTRFILNSRGLTRAVTMSSLLERHPGIRDMMDRGELVPDTMARPAPSRRRLPEPYPAEACALTEPRRERAWRLGRPLQAAVACAKTFHRQGSAGMAEWRMSTAAAALQRCGAQVGDALLDVIFDPGEADAAGLVIDGFPRTALQVGAASAPLPRTHQTSLGGRRARAEAAGLKRKCANTIMLLAVQAR